MKQIGKCYFKIIKFLLKSRQPNVEEDQQLNLKNQLVINLID